MPKTAWLLALAAAVAACSQTTSTRGRWVTAEGTPADPTALRAANVRCRERVQVVSRQGPGENVEWGVAMLDCLRSEGFVLVSDDPEIAR